MADNLLTLEQFGASVKAQYPDYASVPDAELGAKMLEKYPEYKDRVRVAPMNTALVNGQPVPVDEPTMKTSAGIGSALGGAVGGIAGGIPGAMLGGAAGEGFEQLVRHARELPAATWDVLKNLVEQPSATIEGFARGAIGGGEQAATGAATQGAMQGVGQVAGALAMPVAQKVAGGLMQSALKPGIRGTLAAMRRGVPVPPVVQTLLNEGVNVTPGGIEKLNGIIGATNADIKAAINGLPSGTAINPFKVTSRLGETAQRFGAQVNPDADLQAVTEAGREFLGNNLGPLSPQRAQALKTGTYAALKSKSYGEVKGASIEAQKTLARGLKEELAAEAQKSGIDLTTLNAREGAALDAREAVAKRVAQVGNRDPAGLAWLAHNPMTFLAAVMERSPVVKSMLARGLYQSAERASGISSNILRLVMATIAESGDDTQAQP